ncbi:neo-calmodulin-like [Mytilus trossulus]|uniref:neo-calmodulin-like n=1 Tax=Mytilus trossulus TaxID=6551 RepID=UPI0030059791
MEEQDRQRLDTLFSENCTDGVVIRDGFKAILQCMGNNPTDESIDEVFANFDADGTTGLSKDEFDEWFNKCWVPVAQAREAIVEAFQVLAAESEDSDGRCCITSLVDLLKNRGGEPLSDEDAAIFQKELEIIDTSSDGFIDGEEFANFLTEQCQEVKTEEENQEQTEEVQTETTEEITETSEEQTEEQIEKTEKITEKTEDQNYTTEEQTDKQNTENSEQEPSETPKTEQIKS